LQQVGGGHHRGFAQHWGHLEREIVVAGELQRGVFARQFVRRAAAAVAGRRRVRALPRGRRGRGEHDVRLRGRQRGCVRRRHRGRVLVGYRLAHGVHLVSFFQVLRKKLTVVNLHIDRILF